MLFFEVSSDPCVGPSSRTNISFFYYQHAEKNYYILFNIFLCDMFFMVDNKNIASWADDNFPYSVGKSYVT